MRLLRYFGLLTMRRRYERLMVRDFKGLTARVHRLEMVVDGQADELEHLKARQATLATRLGGALGGRPRAAARGASANGQLDLDAIPRGDKEGLRAYFKLKPPTKE